MRFRRVDDTDIATLHRWLNDPVVVRWWEGEDVSREAVRADYGPGGDQRVEHWIAVDDVGVDVGWIQCYAIDGFLDDPDGDEPRARAVRALRQDEIGRQLAGQLPETGL